MIYTDVRKIFSNIILDPYTLKDLRLLVAWTRQDFINSVMNLRTLELAKRDEGGFLRCWWKIRKIDKAIQIIRAEIREKGAILDNVERALKIAENNNYEEMERRNFYEKALEEAEIEDNARYEENLERINKNIEQMSERSLLMNVSKQLAEIIFSLKKTNCQSERRREWQLNGPPSRVRDEFEKLLTERRNEFEKNLAEEKKKTKG